MQHSERKNLYDLYLHHQRKARAGTQAETMEECYLGYPQAHT